MPTEDFPCAPLNVLVADDYALNLRIVARLLGKRGHHVETASNGQEAVEKALAGTFDLILMDCRMPVMDGTDAAAVIRRAEGAQRRTPIIAITANGSDDDRRECLEAGMDHIIVKPVDDGSLSVALELARQLRGPAGQAAFDVDRPSPAQVLESPR